MDLLVGDPGRHAGRRDGRHGASPGVRPRLRSRGAARLEAGLAWGLAVAAALAVAGCSGGARRGARGDRAGTPITVKGSDTMVILAQRWAEGFMRVEPSATVQVSGGGSGTGIAALLGGTTHIATASRPMTDDERARLRARHGVEPTEIPVALDAVAVYVHRDNPVASLTTEQLRAIFRGRVRSWREVGGPDRPIVLYSRENNSGTYAFFKEHVLEGLDFAVEAQTLPGTAAVINAVGHDPCGVGYGGIGFGRRVRVVPIADRGGPAVAPSLDAARRGAYPLARRLFMYTAGAPEGTVGAFVAWVRSPPGQALVEAAGFYPMSAEADSPSMDTRAPEPGAATRDAAGAHASTLRASP
jgi:phosphate transport system substrate-binding protein